MTHLIPAHKLFTGELPDIAATQTLQQLEIAEKNLSPWQLARLGKITASRFPQIKYLRGTNTWSETAKTYLYDLIGEHLTGQPADTFTGNRATDWGTFHEAEAIEAYKRRTRRKIQPQPLLKHPTLPWVGGTPDGAVGERGLIEAKCPLSFKNHIRTVITRTIPDEYRDQVLGQIWLSGRDWCDFVSYDPRITGPHRLVVLRINRDNYENEIDDLAERIEAFHELLLETLAKLNVKPGEFIPKPNSSSRP